MWSLYPIFLIKLDSKFRMFWILEDVSIHKQTFSDLLIFDSNQLLVFIIDQYERKSTRDKRDWFRDGIGWTILLFFNYGLHYAGYDCDHYHFLENKELIPASLISICEVVIGKVEVDNTLYFIDIHQHLSQTLFLR